MAVDPILKKQWEQSEQLNEPIPDWWDRAHREQSQYWLTGSPGHEVWDRLDVMPYIRKGATVLNVGVGKGLCTRDLAVAGCNVHVLDISRIALDSVKDVATGWHVDDLDSLPPDTFDLAMSHLVAQHMLEDDLLAQMRAVLRSLARKGVFAIQFKKPLPSDRRMPEATNNRLEAKTGGVERSPELMAELVAQAGGKAVYSEPKEFTDQWAWHVIHAKSISNANSVNETINRLISGARKLWAPDK